jgi:hypothetical protein
MSESLTIDFNNADEHDFDTDEIQVSGGNTQCKLDQVNAPFTEDFADDTDHTYNPDFAEFPGGSVRQVDTPGGAISGAMYETSIDMESWSGGTVTGTATGGAAIAGNRLDLAHLDVRYVDYDGANQFGTGNAGCVKLKYTPKYTGNPGGGGDMTIFTCAKVMGSDISNFIMIRHTSAGKIQLLTYDAAGVIIFNYTTTGDWSPTADTQYELELNYDFTTGATRLFIDGVQFGDTQTATGTINKAEIGDIRIGSNYGGTDTSNFYIEDLVIYETIQHTTNYTKGYTLYSTRYVETSDVLPEMEHAGDGTIKSFVSLSMTYTGSPRILLEVGRSGDKLYWNGSAWVVSDETYAQATDPTTFNTNCTSLTVDGENYGQFTIVFPDSDTQSSVSELTATMNVDIYPTTNPTIEPDASFRTDEIESLVVTYVATGSDAVNCVMKKEDTWYYWTGSAWTSTAGNLYAESSTVADAMANITTLVSASEEVKIKFFLHSHDGTTSPSVSSALFTYSYGGDAPDVIDTCTVWGYMRNNDGTVNSSAFTVRLEKDVVKYKTNTLIRSKEITVTPDDSAYFEVDLVETDNMDGSPKYIWEYATGQLEYCNVPNQARAFRGDLT